MNLQPRHIAWIAVDWGTTHLRVYAMSAGGDVLDEASSSDGMAGLNRDDFEPALLRLIEPWLNAGIMQVLACGMVGARQGWVEAPYNSVPCTTDGNTPIKIECQDKRIQVFIVPGIKQPQPADVMRGEETQIAGFLEQQPDFDGVICLPGTHTKWAHISAKEIVSFRTFMTGEMFGLVSEHSVLRHSVSGQGWDDIAFLNAVDETLSRPEVLAAKLFSIRADSLLNNQENTLARAKLSGYLIGAELAGAKPYWLGQPIVIIGATNLVKNYQSALLAQGAETRIVEGAEMTLLGLTAARNALAVTV